MQIIEVSEQKNESKSKDNEIAIGIDFGTTNSVIAISKNQAPVAIKDAKGRELVPSTITIKNSGFTIGDGADFGINTIYSIKRLLGKTTDEILSSTILTKLLGFSLDKSSSKPNLQIFDKTVNLSIIAAEIFKYLKIQAEKHLSHNLTKAVLTVPAYFDAAAKGDIMLAAKIAGFDVIRLMNEPTAAAYAYGLQKDASGAYLVYDFGGGTFDVSVLYMKAGILQVIATAGDNMLGGDDCDNLIAEYLSGKYNIDCTRDLIIIAKSIKESLSLNKQITASYKNLELELTIDEYKTIIMPLLMRTIKITKEVMDDSEIENLAGIILIGGSTRIPFINELLSEHFDTKILSNIDPDKAVAYGASLQAENLICSSGNLLIDVVPLSLGMEMYGGIVEKIILRNTPIPFSVTKEFTTHADYQTGMKFHILQGEREMVGDCRSLARFELKDLPRTKAGMIKVEVTFSIDVNGILSVAALEKTIGQLQSVTIQPTYGLDAEEIEAILDEAYLNAAIDHNNRLLTEAVIDARTLIEKLEQAIASTPKLLQLSELEKILTSIDMLKANLTSSTPERELIIRNTEQVKKIAHNFIETQMNYAASSLLEGKNIKEL